MDDVDVLFEDAAALAAWLEQYKKIPSTKASAAANVLFPRGFDSSLSLKDISVEMLQANGVSDALAQLLFHKLKTPPHEAGSTGNRKRDRKENYDGGEDSRYNLLLTIRSPNGTAISTHVIMDCTVPTTEPAFWSLVDFQDGPDQDGKVTVMLKDSTWARLRGFRLSASEFAVSDGAYHFQIQRFSTPDNSPSSTNDLNRASFDPKELASSVRAVFSTSPFEDRIPRVLVDSTIESLISFFRSTSDDSEDPKAIKTLFAMPGSGKTRSVKEAARMARGKLKRIRISTDDPMFATINDTDALTQHVLAFVFKAAEKDSLMDITRQNPIIIHFDEVQVFLQMDHGEEKLQRLAQVCHTIVCSGGTAFPWLKFVFSGTNINAQTPIKLGSGMKADPISFTGSFPADFVKGLFEKFICPPSDEHLEIFERCRHNRRVTENFLKNAWSAQARNGVVGTASDHYEDARRSVSETIFSELGASRVSLGACRIFRLMLQSISKGRISFPGNMKILTLLVENSDDLSYVLGGGLNVRSIENGTGQDAGKTKVGVFYPEGCVIEILSIGMSRAVQPDTITSLLSFLHTSQMKTFNLGWFFEALVVYDLKCADSEFESQLNEGLRHQDILQAEVIKDEPQLWRRIPAAPTEEVIWGVHDEMNRHQNRWIDVAYRQEDNAAVIIECKSGVSPQNNQVARTFFENATNLAVSHPTITWIAVYACFHEVHAEGEKWFAPRVNYLTKKIMTMNQDATSILGGIFAIAKQSGDAEVEALTQNLQSHQAIINESENTYIQRRISRPKEALNKARFNNFY